MPRFFWEASRIQQLLYRLWNTAIWLFRWLIPIFLGKNFASEFHTVVRIHLPGMLN